MQHPCPNVREDLVAYLDGELPALRAAELEEHLRLCPPCRALAEEHREVWRLLDHAEPVRIPDGFVSRVLLRVRGARASSGAPLLRVGVSWLAAAAVLLLVLIPFGADFLRPVRTDLVELTGDELEAALEIDVLENLEELRAMDALFEVDDPAMLRSVMDVGEEVY